MYQVRSSIAQILVRVVKLLDVPKSRSVTAPLLCSLLLRRENRNIKMIFNVVHLVHVQCYML